MTDKQRSENTQDTAGRRVGVLTTIGSVLSAFFGVQSSNARVRDFSRGSPLMFFGVALGLTAGFVIVLVIIVQLLLRNSGAVG